ncbi:MULTISPECIES: hypothetical protein [Streptomyces]|uniref:Uncharacterized protein n=1 Tax=Streptomyces flaveolus TaxID=67297 RepID=A0ABV3ALS0_9ACTN|nr:MULTISPECIES: hypothetical protein [Streptomyces]
MDASDHLADFSSRRPGPGGDGLKPEITAPGVGILAARVQTCLEGRGRHGVLLGQPRRGRPLSTICLTRQVCVTSVTCRLR